MLEKLVVVITILSLLTSCDYLENRTVSLPKYDVMDEIVFREHIANMQVCAIVANVLYKRTSDEMWAEIFSALIAWNGVVVNYKKCNVNEKDAIAAQMCVGKIINRNLLRVPAPKPDYPEFRMRCNYTQSMVDKQKSCSIGTNYQEEFVNPILTSHEIFTLKDTEQNTNDDSYYKKYYASNCPDLDSIGELF